MSSIPFRERVTCTIAQACEATSLGRTTVYEMIKKNEIKVTKAGRRTLVLVGPLLDALESRSR
jgi:excisionase family DNA binding protein